jgi:hypothetical protein
MHGTAKAPTTTPPIVPSESPDPPSVPFCPEVEVAKAVPGLVPEARPHAVVALESVDVAESGLLAKHVLAD